MATTTVRRAAFDVGSGSTKMQCSDCEISADGQCLKIVNVLFGQERPVSFGADYMCSKTGDLSEDIQELGLQTLQDLKQEAVNLGATQFSAIATEVFRKANNGESYLDKARSLCRFPFVVLTQALEAEVGYESVMAMRTHPPGNEVDESSLSSKGCAWDSGGASFQITSIDRSCEPQVIQSYMGALGTSVTTAILVREVQKQELTKETPVNPVSKEHCSHFLEVLTSKLIQEVPDWLRETHTVHAASGPNSMFNLCCDILTRLRSADRPLQSFTTEDVSQALEACLNRSNEVLKMFVDFPYSDGPRLIVPKLCLLLAVMRHTGVQAVHTVRCVGSCAGVMKDFRLWN